ncbi:DUF6155 family protein [Caloramator sp. mosi_1]|uniref:DUF6155 family protein n=1 Tax=Caloramator sp. mosi_1 TaxID=3023090 RepID=UPI002362BDFD|nr:DUF6155 family protein [Caloramator sp. mosi_1]WDC85806.1 DUF6155 family protein [Caloramator sp. mosi_1]
MRRFYGKFKDYRLKKYLKTLTNEELQNEILNLIKNFKEVKEYYTTKINPESEIELLEKYKKIVKNEFLPDRGFGKMRYNLVNKAIADFKKIAKDARNIADLMLYYVEVGVEFTNTFGDIDEKFYGNIEKAYNKALEQIFETNLEQEFKERAAKIMDESSGIGWGFAYNIQDIYFWYYSDDDEE